MLTSKKALTKQKFKKRRPLRRQTSTESIATVHNEFGASDSEEGDENESWGNRLERINEEEEEMLVGDGEEPHPDNSRKALYDGLTFAYDFECSVDLATGMHSPNHLGA